MNLKKEFNRLSGMFGDGVEKVHGATDDFGDRVREEASTMMKRARGGLQQSRGSIVSVEEMLERHMRENSTLYMIAGLLLLGLIVTRVAMPRASMQHRDW